MALSLTQLHQSLFLDEEEAEMLADTMRKKWVRALWEPMINMETTKECVTVGDINGDEDYKLILVDMSNEQFRLKLLKGLSVVTDSYLAEQPAGIIHFISDTGHPPCVAAAVGSSLLVYRNMKPYYRYNIPQSELHPTEVELWKAAIQKTISPRDLCAGLEQIRAEISMNRMSFQSQHYLTLGDDETRQDAVAQTIAHYGDRLNITNMLITCITTIKKVSTSKLETDVIIVGTELGSICWIDCQAYNVLSSHTITGTPYKLLALGQYDLESRLFVATRESDVVVIKRNQKGEVSTSTLTMKSPVVCMTVSKNHIVLATQDNRLVYCTFKGKKQHEVQLSETIVDMETFFYEPKQYSGILVAFRNQVSVYIDQYVADTLKMDHEIEWIKFGRFGREDAVLIIGTTIGGIGVHIFRRTANLHSQPTEFGPPASQKIKLDIPKRTRIYVDQSLREREDPSRMHSTYQRDLYMLRLHLTKAFAQLTASHSGVVPTKESEKIDVNVDVNGFGPTFRVNVVLSVADDMPKHTRWLAFKCDKKEYEFEMELIHIPVLAKNSELSFTNGIKCLNPDKGAQGEVKVFILSETKRAPIWMTTFEMPLSEQPLF